MLEVILKNFEDFVHMIDQRSNRITRPLIVVGCLWMSELKTPGRAAIPDLGSSRSEPVLAHLIPTRQTGSVGVVISNRQQPAREQPSAINPVTRQISDLQQLPIKRMISLAASLAIAAIGYATTTWKWLAGTQTPSITMGITWTLTNAAVLAGALYDPSPAGAVRPALVTFGCAALLVAAICKNGRIAFSRWDQFSTGLSVIFLGGFILSKFGAVGTSAAIFSPDNALFFGTLAGIVGSIPKLLELYLSTPPPPDNSARGYYRPIVGAAFPMGLVCLSMFLNAWTLWAWASTPMRFATTFSAVDVAAIGLGESYKRWRQLKRK